MQIILIDCTSELDSGFGPQVSPCLRSFDFTLTFEESILTLIPTVLFIIAACPRLLSLLRRRRVITHKGLAPVKSVVSILLATLYLALVIFSATEARPKTRITDAVCAMSLLASILICALSHLEHIRSVRPSALLEVFLFFTAIFDVVRARTLWLISSGSVISILFTSSIGVKLVLLALEIKGKKKLLKDVVAERAPEETSGLISRSFFIWLIRLLIIGYQRILSPNDMYPLDQEMHSETIAAKFVTAWRSVPSGSKHTLMDILAKVFKWQLIAPIFPRILLIGFTFAQPLLINRVLVYLSAPETVDKDNIGYGLIGAYAIVYTGIAISTAYYWYRVIRATTMMRGALVTCIYAKATETDITSVDDSAAVTLMSTDIERITNGFKNMHEIWANPIEIAIGIYLLQIEIDLAALVALFVALICAVLGVWLALSAGKRQKAWMDALQKRIGVTSNTLGSMKGVKMSGLTDSLYRMIHGLRVTEIKSASSFRQLQITTLTLATVPLTITPLLTFGLAAVIASNSHTILDVERIFTSLSILTLLATKFTNLFQSLPALMGAFACLARIQKFLLTGRRRDDRNQSTKSRLPDDMFSGFDINLENPFDVVMSGDRNPAIELKKLTRYPNVPNDIKVVHASFKWNDDLEPALHDITMTAKQSQLTMIVGPIASGKSTLLKGILGELKRVGGSVDVVHRNIAFCDQTPWLRHATVQQNIVGFSRIDHDRYAAVLYACALTTDIAQLPSGDQTVIGSKGITLSGGQKQRIAIARAVYADKRIAIFDDVMSGLDATTSQHIFQYVFGPKGMLRQRATTVVLATHAVHFAPSADHIVALHESGRIAEQGHFRELNESDGYISRLNIQEQSEKSKSNKRRTHHVPMSSLSSDTPSTEAETAASLAEEESSAVSEEIQSRQRGDVGVYAYYFRSAGILSTVFFIIAEVIFTILEYFPSLWLKWWAESNVSDPNKKTGYYMGVYAAFQLLCLGALYIGARHMNQTMVVNSGKTLHAKLLNTVLSAPMSFFNKTDTGAILNRFSQDLQLLDSELPISLLLLGVSAFGCVAQAALVLIASYWTGFAFAGIFVVFYFVQRHYLRTSRQLRYLELEAKSPLYSLFVETLDGLATVRAFGWQDQLQKRNLELLDSSQKPLYLLYCIQRWLTLVLGLISAALATILMTLVITLRHKSSAGFAGVALVNMISFSSSLMNVVLIWAQLETSIGAVSRVRKFEAETLSEKLPVEDFVPSDHWPSNGEVTYSNLSATYSFDIRPALNNINLTIQPGEKVAICGRSGSGKSSMILALFRMMEITGGSIDIDGLDHATMQPQHIRSRLNALPQEPYLLAGTIRVNADPTGSSTDEEIIRALERVDLWHLLEKKGGLDLETDLEFLSQGQCQLFCLARAILRKSSIVVLDEVTSSVDVDTEKLMQRIIMEEFAGRTVIMVAHRFDLVLDCDRVVLLDHGSIIECDSPAHLLSYPSAFSELFDTFASRKETEGQAASRRDRDKQRESNRLSRGRLSGSRYSGISRYSASRYSAAISPVIKPQRLSWMSVHSNLSTD